MQNKTLVSCFLVLVLSFFGCPVILGESAQPKADPSTGLFRYDNCLYLDGEWNDGDSFQVQLPTGKIVTARLYQVDCIETSIHDTTAARRLRAQRRYFGISGYGDTPRDSINKAIELGEAASVFARQQLAAPFTLWTSHADARGGGNRIYVFIETADGKSLADLLVKEGLARAFGVYRQTQHGVSQGESLERMKDLEFSAAASRRGAWAYTDWDALPGERLAERAELEELRFAMRSDPLITTENPLAIDQADAASLQQLPGIGSALAQRIIETRESQPFLTKEDIRRVPGIGGKTFEILEPLIIISGSD